MFSIFYLNLQKPYGIAPFSLDEIKAIDKSYVLTNKEVVNYFMVLLLWHVFFSSNGDNIIWPNMHFISRWRIKSHLLISNLWTLDSMIREVSALGEFHHSFALGSRSQYYHVVGSLFVDLQAYVGDFPFATIVTLATQIQQVTQCTSWQIKRVETIEALLKQSSWKQMFQLSIHFWMYQH